MKLKKKAKKNKELTENDRNRMSGCQDFAFEIADMLRIYISPKKAAKLGKKLYAFVEEEVNRYERFKKLYPSGVSDLKSEVNESLEPPASQN